MPQNVTRPMKPMARTMVDLTNAEYGLVIAYRTTTSAGRTALRKLAGVVPRLDRIRAEVRATAARIERRLKARP